MTGFDVETKVKALLFKQQDITAYTKKYDKQYLGRWMENKYSAEPKIVNIVCVIDGYGFCKSTQKAISIADLTMNYSHSAKFNPVQSTASKGAIAEGLQKTPDIKFTDVVNENTEDKSDITPKEVNTQQTVQEIVIEKKEVVQQIDTTLDTGTQTILNAIETSKKKGDTFTIDVNVNLELPFDLEKIYSLCDMFGIEKIKVVDAVLNNKEIVNNDLLNSIVIEALQSAPTKK